MPIVSMLVSMPQVFWTTLASRLEIIYLDQQSLGSVLYTHRGAVGTCLNPLEQRLEC